MEIHNPIVAIVLAAGKGSRMNSGGLSKVLHEVNGTTMLDRVLKTLHQVNISQLCLVLGDDWADFSKITDQYPNLAICLQKKRNGTAGAVASCTPYFKELNPITYAPGYLQKGLPITAEGYTLVCYGDTPMIKSSVLSDFMAYTPQTQV